MSGESMHMKAGKTLFKGALAVMYAALIGLAFEPSHIPWIWIPLILHLAFQSIIKRDIKIQHLVLVMILGGTVTAMVLLKQTTTWLKIAADWVGLRALSLTAASVVMFIVVMKEMWTRRKRRFLSSHWTPRP